MWWTWHYNFRFSLGSCRQTETAALAGCEQPISQPVAKNFSLFIKSRFQKLLYPPMNQGSPTGEVRQSTSSQENNSQSDHLASRDKKNWRNQKNRRFSSNPAQPICSSSLCILLYLSFSSKTCFSTLQEHWWMQLALLSLWRNKYLFTSLLTTTMFFHLGWVRRVCNMSNVGEMLCTKLKERYAENFVCVLLVQLGGYGTFIHWWWTSLPVCAPYHP